MSEWLKDVTVEDALAALSPREREACLRRALRKIVAKVRIAESIHNVRLDEPKAYLNGARSELLGNYKRGPKTGQPKIFLFTKPNGVGSLIAGTAENLINRARKAAVQSVIQEEPYVDDAAAGDAEDACRGIEDWAPDDSGSDYYPADSHSSAATPSATKFLDRNAKDNRSLAHGAVVQIGDALRRKSTERRRLALQMIEMICGDPERFIDATDEPEMDRRLQPKTNEIAEAMGVPAYTISKLFALLRTELAALGAASFPELMSLMEATPINQSLDANETVAAPDAFIKSAASFGSVDKGGQ